MLVNLAGLPFIENKLFRWLQLAMGVVCMAMIVNLQYGWILFVDPIDAKYHWGRAAIQLAFTLFVVTETWLVPIGRGSSTNTVPASSSRSAG
jgi:OFA family oxalate/formate antiporter-like MFS transporter